MIHNISDSSIINQKFLSIVPRTYYYALLTLEILKKCDVGNRLQHKVYTPMKVNEPMTDM